MYSNGLESTSLKRSSCQSAARVMSEPTITCLCLLWFEISIIYVCGISPVTSPNWTTSTCKGIWVLTVFISSSQQTKITICIRDCFVVCGGRCVPVYRNEIFYSDSLSAPMSPVYTLTSSRESSKPTFQTCKVLTKSVETFSYTYKW